MEDEHGPINVIVKPKIYERDRSAVRWSPSSRCGDGCRRTGASMNVIAFEVTALRAGDGCTFVPPKCSTIMP